MISVQKEKKPPKEAKVQSWSKKSSWPMKTIAKAFNAIGGAARDGAVRASGDGGATPRQEQDKATKVDRPSARRRAWSRRDRKLYVGHQGMTAARMATEACSSAWARAAELSLPMCCVLVEGWWSIPVRFWGAGRALASPKKWRRWAIVARSASWNPLRLRKLEKESMAGMAPRERRAQSERQRR
jgi:hypothetical protein